jgi:hypothetical protein
VGKHHENRPFRRIILEEWYDNRSFRWAGHVANRMLVEEPPSSELKYCGLRNWLSCIDRLQGSWSLRPMGGDKDT